MSWQFGHLLPLRYGGIIADPPWRIELRSANGEHKAPQRHYPCMPTEQICELRVHELASRNSLLWMWATAPMIRNALRVMDAWGFRYVTMGAWAKRSPRDTSWNMGTGYVLRSRAEFYLIGAIGSPRILSRSVTNLIVAPVRGHSVKPPQAHEDMERLTDGPYCELFGRRRRKGWEVWGNDPAVQPLSDAPLTEGVGRGDVNAAP